MTKLSAIQEANAMKQLLGFQILGLKLPASEVQWSSRLVSSRKIHQHGSAHTVSPWFRADSKYIENLSMIFEWLPGVDRIENF
jgi:hypothetical protein